MNNLPISEEKCKKYNLYLCNIRFISTKRQRCICSSVLWGMCKGKLVDIETISKQTRIALDDVKGTIRKIPCIEKIMENGETLYYINFQKADELYRKRVKREPPDIDEFGKELEDSDE